jgi:hypothetical protein
MIKTIGAITNCRINGEFMFKSLRLFVLYYIT